MYLSLKTLTALYFSKNIDSFLHSSKIITHFVFCWIQIIWAVILQAPNSKTYYIHVVVQR